MNMCTQGEPGIFSHVSMMGLKNDQSLYNRKWMCYTLFNQLCIQCAVCVIFTLWKLDMCSKLPLPSLIFLFWASGYTYTKSRSFCPLWTPDVAHVRKNTKLSLPAQLRTLEQKSLGMRLLHPTLTQVGCLICSAEPLRATFFYAAQLEHWFKLGTWWGIMEPSEAPYYLVILQKWAR